MLEQQGTCAPVRCAERVALGMSCMSRCYRARAAPFAGSWWEVTVREGRGRGCAGARQCKNWPQCGREATRQVTRLLIRAAC